MVYSLTLTNPLASGHDGSWKLDLLMECVVGTPAETPTLANGDTPTQAVSRDHPDGDGGVGSARTGADGRGAEASANTSSSQQQTHPSDHEEVEDISSDEDEDDDDDDGGDGAGGAGGGHVPDTSAQGADHMDAPEISEDEDLDDDDGIAVEDEDAVTGNLHETEGMERRSMAAGEVAGRVDDGVRTDGAADVDTASSRAKEGDHQAEDLDRLSQGTVSRGVGREAEGSQNGPSTTPSDSDSTGSSRSQQQQQQQQRQQRQQQLSVLDLSSEDETITEAFTERRKPQGLPTATQLSGRTRPDDRAGRQRTRASPPPSPPASPARSSSSSSRSSSPESVMSHQSAENVGDDSDSAFDGSDENSAASIDETDEFDSDEYEVDILPPDCFVHHNDRPTYKKALCFECYTKHEEALKKHNMDMSDIDSDTGRPTKTAAARLRKKKRASGGGRSEAGGGKRPRKSRRSSSSGNSSGERRKRRKVVGGSSATAGSAPARSRRLVKPHRKKSKKLAAGADEAVSSAMSLEDTTSSSSGGGGEGTRDLRRDKGKNKRVAGRPRIDSDVHSIPRKNKQGNGSEGGGMNGDFLGALIANPAPARKKADLSSAGPAAPAPQGKGKRPKLARHGSVDAVERRDSRQGGRAAAVGSDGRRAPQMVRGGSLDTGISSMSLSQYQLQKDVTGVLPSSSLRRPDKALAGSKIPRGAPSDGVGKKTGAENARRSSNIPALGSSTNSSINRGISRQTLTTPVPAPSSKLNDKYEEVENCVGVRRKRSNGKYFVWVQGAPLDGVPYETAKECARAYDRLHPSSGRGNPNGHRRNVSDARAPSHVDSDSLTPLVGSRGSRLSKATLTSGYKQPRRNPFFAPTETPSRLQPAKAPPRQRPAGVARGQQPPEVARAAQRQPPQAVASRQQHGAAAVMALIDGPSAKRSSNTSHTQNPPPPPVAAFNSLGTSKVKWRTPIKCDEDLNGRRVLPKVSVLPERSALARSKCVPDTRTSCAQRGISGTFRMPNEPEEEERQGDDGEDGAETGRVSPEGASAPSPGSPMLEHVSDDDGPCYDNPEAEGGDSPQVAEEPVAVPSPSAISSTLAASPSTSPSRAVSPGPPAAESAEENGDEEQGRELMMNFMAGNPGEDEREPTSNSTEGAVTAEGGNEELGGEEEQGRELMMRMAAGRGASPPAVSPADEEEDEMVPPSPHSAAESNDGSDDLSSGEDESDAGGDENDDSNDSNPPPLVQWKKPKLTSAPVGGGADIGGGIGGNGGRTSSAKALSPGPSSNAGANVTVVHKPALSMRSHTRFGATVATPPMAAAAATGTSPSSSKRSPQLPLNDSTHESLPDANTMPAPPNPPLAPSGPPQQVAWRTPRQTAAVPAAITPTSSVDQQQQDRHEEQHAGDTPLELELPSEVVDALNPPAVQVLSTEVPSTPWRPPARAVARHQGQRHVVPPALSTSPPSSASSAPAPPTSRERVEPTGRESRPLPRFGDHPFRPPDERDVIPQGQLNALSSNAKRLAASKVGAVGLPRQRQRDANGRSEANDVPFDGEPGRSFVERRSTSSSSGPPSRRSTSSSRSSSNNTNASRQRRPDHPPRDEFGRIPRDGHGRGGEGRGHGESSHGSTNSSRPSSRTGPGGRMAGYRDRGDRDIFGRDPRDGRGTGGYGDNRNASGRDARSEGRDRRGDFHSHARDGGRKSGNEGSWGGFHARRYEHDGSGSRSRHRRDRSRSPKRSR